jgi:hypothetical protein
VSFIKDKVWFQLYCAALTGLCANPDCSDPSVDAKILANEALAKAVECGAVSPSGIKPVPPPKV